MNTEADQEYVVKEGARAALLNALVTYKDAADAYGLDETQMGDEITDLFSDAGLGLEAVIA